MTQREYRTFKDNYLRELKNDLELFLNQWVKDHDTIQHKDLNDLVVDTFINNYQRIKTLTYFPQYDLPKEIS